MFTKTFKEMPHHMITGDSFQLKTVNGSTYTISIPETIDNGYQSYFTQYALRIPGMMKGTLYSESLSYSSTGGVCFGTGTAAPTEDDYTITQKVLNSSVATVAVVVEQNGSTITGTYTIINISTSAFTITEVGMFGNCMYNKNRSYCYLVDRTLLEEPLTINPSESGKIVYTITIE